MATSSTPFLAQEGLRERLAREARLVARLQHSNIWYDYSGETQMTANGHQKNHPKYFWFLNCGRGHLKRFAEQYPLADIPELGGMIIWQLALALKHAHRQGIILGLKAENANGSA